ncbi:ABC transporter permease subunit [Candidatus Latescibacterota bacterium]
MILSIAFKEFYDNLVSARFTIGFLLCLFLIPFTMIVSINDYRSQVRAYEMDKKQADENNRVSVYSALRPEIVRPPEPLSIFSRGISYQVGNRVKILLGEKPLLAGGRSSVSENPLLNSFFSLDFSTITAIIMSLLAFLFTYDSCSGEREQGTLKLIFSNSVSRSKILLGKVIGVFLTILPIIIFCYILSAIIILFHPDISFSPDEWIRIALIFFLSLIFFTLFGALGLLISSRVRTSVTSIVLCLFLWVAVVFVIPNMAVYVAESFLRTDSLDNLSYTLDVMEKEYNEECKQYRDTLDQPDWWMHWNMKTRDDGYMELAGSTRSLMELYRTIHQFTQPLMIDYADRKWALQKAYLDKLDRQRKFAEKLALLSPSEMFRQVVSALCRTDVLAHYRFLERVSEYREEFIQFFRDEKIFSSFEYFTRQNPDTFMTADEIVRTRTGGRFQTNQEYRVWASANNGDFSPFMESRYSRDKYRRIRTARSGQRAPIHLRAGIHRRRH